MLARVRTLLFPLATLIFLSSPILVPAANAQAIKPTIFFTDLVSGPNSGGEQNLGAFVSVVGRNFGSSRGTSTVTVGGGAVAAYPLWSSTKIIVQLGPKAITGPLVVKVAGATSNSINFTVRTGRIFFVSTADGEGDRLRRGQGGRPQTDRTDVVHRGRHRGRHAGVHEPRAGRAEPARRR